MVRPEVIRRRLQRFCEYLKILQRFQRYDLETFLSDPEHYGGAERFLQLVIEASLDMGSHIIADQNLGAIEQSRDIPRRPNHAQHEFTVRRGNRPILEPVPRSPRVK